MPLVVKYTYHFYSRIFSRHLALLRQGRRYPDHVTGLQLPGSVNFRLHRQRQTVTFNMIRLIRKIFVLSLFICLCMCVRVCQCVCVCECQVNDKAKYQVKDSVKVDSTRGAYIRTILKAFDIA